MSWIFRWASSFGSDFNLDHSVRFSSDEQQRDGGIEYNYHREEAEAFQPIRRMLADWGMWQWLDRAPKGRNETGHWWRRHDEYDNR